MPPTTQTTGVAAPPGLDPQIVNLAKAIRQTESQGNFQAAGKSGEYGAYQFLPSTWNATAPKYGVNVPLQQATPQQQNEVAYKQLAEWKQQHPDWNVGNFASAWNAGPGKPDAYLQNNVGTNSQGVNYDTPAYAKKVAEAYQSIKAGTYQDPSTGIATAGTPTQEAAPSVGGFLGNVVKSGAGLLGNIGEAILHPIQTVQNIGGAAVGGLEEASGQTTDNTAKFDNLVGYFKNRYGSMSNFESTLYHDPVGVAADISSVFGGAGLAAKGAGLAAKIGEAGDAASIAARNGADFVAGANGIAPATVNTAGQIRDFANAAGDTLNRASALTNPLSPIIAGVGKAIGGVEPLIKEGGGQILGVNPIDIENILRTPDAFTTEQMANTTRDALGAEVEQAFSSKLAEQRATGLAYSPIRNADAIIPVEHNFLEDQLRTQAGLDVVDGKIVMTADSRIRGPGEINKLQGILDTYKPEFQKGTLTPNQYLNLREDLGNVAYNDLGKKDSAVARVTDSIRHGLNEKYRGNIPGLQELDLKFSNQEQAIKSLRKGLFDKNGKPTESLTNLVANAGNKGNEARLARLEEILPGITERLKILRTIENLQNNGIKVGTYTRSISQAARVGGIVLGAATGNVKLLAGALAMDFISSPEHAVPMLRAFAKIQPEVVNATVAMLARYAVMGGVASKATQPGQAPLSPPQSVPQGTDGLPSDVGVQPQTTPDTQNIQPQQQGSLDSLAKANNFDLQAARSAGYTDQEIIDFLSNPTPPPTQ